MTSELRLVSRRLLQAGTLPLAPRALPRLAFPQVARTISTTSPLCVSRDAKPRPTWASRTSRANPFDPAPVQTPAAPQEPAAPTPAAAPAATAETTTTASAPAETATPFSQALPTAASRSAASDHIYDATSTGSFDISQIIKDDNADFHKRHYERPKAELRLRPVLGRTVHVSGRIDVASAVMQTNSLAIKNKIKFHYRHQKTHERPGLKRKRLRSERWRARFKRGFKATVLRVQELQNQGW